MPEVIKRYPPRGPLSQVRLATAEPFHCFRCGQEKRSKLHALYQEDWNRRLCNGCYGRLLSIYEVKAGTAPDDERTDALAQVLLELIDEDTARQALARRGLPLVELLGKEAQRFVATAEYVAEHLAGNESLEWSPAVIGLCKAVETELVRLVMEPWRRACASRDLSADIRDDHVGRVARWCAGRTDHAPELGTVAYTLRTIAQSKRHRSCELAGALTEAASAWSGATWVLDVDGLAQALDELGRGHRNRAAHTEALDAEDYAACRRDVLDDDGVLWRLQRAAA